MAWLGAAVPARGASAASPASQCASLHCRTGFEMLPVKPHILRRRRGRTRNPRRAGNRAAQRDTIPSKRLTIHPTPAMSKNDSQLPQPPQAERIAHVTTVHGEQRVDHYHWLRDKDDARVRAHLEGENAYTRAVMAPTAAFQEALYREMLARIQETDMDVPYREGEYDYYSRTEQGKEYPILCRRQARRRGGRGDHARPQCDGAGPRVLLAGRLRREPRREPAGVLDRRHRLSRVHAAGQGSAQRGRCCRCGSRRRAR